MSPPIRRAASNIVVPAATSTGIPSIVTLKLSTSSAIVALVKWKVIPLLVPMDQRNVLVHNFVPGLLRGAGYAIQIHHGNDE